MIRALSIFAALFLFASCSQNPVGNECVIDGINDLVVVDPDDNGNDDGSEPSSVAVVSSPALDCTSRTCLYHPNEAGAEGGVNTPLCSDFCSSSDDCDKVESSPCKSGFACEIASTTGPFCCTKMCICKDYLFIPESGGRPLPAACDPDLEDSQGNLVNQCCNLPGRGDCIGNVSASNDDPVDDE